MTQPSLWFGAGTLAFVAAVVAFVGFAVTRGRPRSPYYFLPPMTAAIAGVAYAVMTLVELGLGPAWVDVPLVRYVDWTLSTPFITYYLAMLAGTKRLTRVGAVALNVALMLLGYASTVTTGGVKWALFAGSAACFLGLLYLFLSTFSAAIDDAPRTSRNLFGSLRDLTVLIWSVYPIAYVLGPGGVGVMGTADYSFVVAVLDVTAKVGFIGIMLARQYQLETFVTTERAVAAE